MVVFKVILRPYLLRFTDAFSRGRQTMHASLVVDFTCLCFTVVQKHGGRLGVYTTQIQFGFVSA